MTHPHTHATNNTMNQTMRQCAGAQMVSVLAYGAVGQTVLLVEAVNVGRLTVDTSVLVPSTQCLQCWFANMLQLTQHYKYIDLPFFNFVLCSSAGCGASWRQVPGDVQTQWSPCYCEQSW